ncbi:ATP-binding protein [Amycolatopsis sp. 195334CR]|uniref:ATP-binding protein n=1 Tax=Amycolatopsis sp. 195334CR TaxID=2814588 RepID=UPI001A9023AA|nr:ATP-binding protein [Amycolatopsis sp. 195334CR]MBN6040079.1 ATP-binding protein [Amycolatopsis sp. 195334CR]
MPRHHLDLPGANTLPTPTFQLVDHDVRDIVEHNALAVVHGDAGLGKTFAVQAALERLRHDLRNTTERLSIVEVALPHTCTPLRVALSLARRILRTPTPESRTRYTLHDDILEHLLSTPHLLVIDEAQKLSVYAMDVIRSLYDDSGTKLAILFVGGDGCWQTIRREPMLRSRVFRSRLFRPLPTAEVPDLMRAYHQLYAHADTRLLASIDARHAHGSWRDWAAFTLTALQHAATAGRDTLDEEITNNTYTTLGSR